MALAPLLNQSQEFVFTLELLEPLNPFEFYK